jgi:hypothetical protein
LDISGDIFCHNAFLLTEKSGEDGTGEENGLCKCFPELEFFHSKKYSNATSLTLAEIGNIFMIIYGTRNIIVEMVHLGVDPQVFRLFEDRD